MESRVVSPSSPNCTFSSPQEGNLTLSVWISLVSTTEAMCIDKKWF